MKKIDSHTKGTTAVTSLSSSHTALTNQPMRREKSHAGKMLDIIQQPAPLSRSDLETIVTLAQALSLDEADNKLLLAAQLLMHMQDLDGELYGDHTQSKSETQFSGLCNFSKNLALSFCALWLVFFLAGLLQFSLASSSSHKSSAEQAYQAFFWGTVIIWSSYALTLLITTCVAICDGYRTKQTHIPYMEITDLTQLTAEDQHKLTEILGDYVVTETSPPIATALSTYIKTGLHGRFFDHSRINQTQMTDDANFTQVEIVVTDSGAKPSEGVSEDLSLHIPQQSM